MNFNTLKIGFISYLEEINQVSNKNYQINDKDISIFMYADEFKNYLTDELNLDSSLCSESIDDLMDLEFVNGQFVLPEENEDGDTDTDGISLGDAMTSPEGTENTNSADTAIPTTEGVEGTKPVEEVVSQNITENSAAQGNINLEDPELITQILNDLLQDATFKKTIDVDQDGEISEEELTNFFNVVKCYDKDENTISLDDLISAAKDIQEGTFRFKTDEEIAEIIGPTPQADAAGITNSGNVGGGSGGNVSSVSGSNSATQKGTVEKTLENMTEQELKSELSTAQSDLSEKQDILSALLDGSDPKLQDLQDAIDTNYEIYQEELKKVDEEMAEQLDSLKEDIEAKEDAIDEKEQQIADQENEVSSCENAYNNAVSTRQNLESIVATLSAVNTSEMDSEKAATHSQKLSDAKAKLAAAEKAEKKAKEEWDKAEEKLDKLNQEKDELITGEGGLDELNGKMAELEAEIAEKYPEIKEYMDAYNEAKEEYATYKDSAVQKAKTDVTEAQNYVNEVQTAINNSDNKKDTKELCVDDLGEEVLKLAYEHLGFSEGQVEGECGYNLPDGLWCAAFVKYVLAETYGDDLPDWYTNCNFNSCSEVLAAAKNNDAAFKDANEAQPGDLIIFNTSRGNARHIGFVVSVEDGVITTIEGNTSSKVAERTYQVGSSNVNSFVRVMG